jgi:hypothetical protein
MDDVTLWRIVATAMLGLVGALWTMQRSEIKSLKEKADQTYSKQETRQLVDDKIDPHIRNMEEMRVDIKDIKNYLIKGSNSG